MRVKRLYILLIMLLISLGSFSQEEINDNLPRIEFKESIFDFGEIAYNSKAKHAFVFKNKGKGPLLITNVRTS